MTHQIFTHQMIVQVKIVKMSYVKEHIINGSTTNPKFKTLLKYALDFLKKAMLI